MSALPVAVYRTDDRLRAIRQLVLDAVSSPASKRAYGWSLDQYFSWWESAGRPPLSRASVMQFRTLCEQRGWSSSSVNLMLSALRKLATEAHENGLLLAEPAAAINRIKGLKRLGIRQGNWLSLEQAQELLNTPDVQTLKGKRDQAILAVLLGTAVRRQELAGLTVGHLQQREGRAVILDLLGKGRRVRTVAVPGWVKASVDRWLEAAGITEGRIFRRMRKGGKIAGESLSPDAVWGVVREHAAAFGVALSPHDCRRTCAKLARKEGKADLDQIQYMLGHSDVATTQRYLGDMQNLKDAPNDQLGLTL